MLIRLHVSSGRRGHSVGQTYPTETVLFCTLKNNLKLRLAATWLMKTRSAFSPPPKKYHRTQSQIIVSRLKLTTNVHWIHSNLNGQCIQPLRQQNHYSFILILPRASPWLRGSSVGVDGSVLVLIKIFPISQ